jgi:hypothetical protein
LLNAALEELRFEAKGGAAFWEQLRRTVATFGFLEDVLGRAIFAITGTARYKESETEAAFERWLPTLERALIDPLWNLIDAYGKALRSSPDATFENLDERLSELRRASTIRNVLCHGSRGSPDSEGKSLPRFVNRQKEVFDTPVDIAFFQQTQRAVVELICDVINSVRAHGMANPWLERAGRRHLQNTVSAGIFDQTRGVRAASGTAVKLRRHGRSEFGKELCG